MNVTYDELQRKTEAINNQIYSDLFEKNEKAFSCDDMSENPENIDDLDITKSILILGINPSSSDLERKGRKNNCFLEYIPEESESLVASSLNNKGYTYPMYFKKFYDLFKDYDCKMLWQNIAYLDRYTSTLDPEEYKFLKSKTIKTNHNYLVFGDLVYFKMTKADAIYQFIEKYSDNIYELFQMQVSYYNPRIVLVANTAASKFLYYHMNKNGFERIMDTELYYHEIPIIFSPMITGQRAIDDFSLARLKKDIGKLLN